MLDVKSALKRLSPVVQVVRCLLFSSQMMITCLSGAECRCFRMIFFVAASHCSCVSLLLCIFLHARHRSWP